MQEAWYQKLLRQDPVGRCQMPLWRMELSPLRAGVRGCGGQQAIAGHHQAAVVSLNGVLLRCAAGPHLHASMICERPRADQRENKA